LATGGGDNQRGLEDKVDWMELSLRSTSMSVEKALRNREGGEN